jgi:hypothetical protein
MTNGGLDGFDWLQNLIAAEDQTSCDYAFPHAGPTAHPAFHDAAEVAKVAFQYSQAQKSYALTEQQSSGSNPSPVYSGNSGRQYGGNQHQHSGVQQQQSFANPSSRSSQYPADRSHNDDRRPSHSASSQRIPTSQVQTSHPSTTAHQDAYRQLIQNTACRAPTEQYSSMAHEIARPSPPTRPAKPTQGQTQPTWKLPYQNYTAIPGHHVGPPVSQQALAQYAVQRQQMEEAKNPHQIYRRSPIPALDFQRASQRAAVQESMPAPPVQETQTPVGRPQSLHTGVYTTLASPKGYQTSVGRTTLDPRHLTIGATNDHATHPASQVGWKPAPTGSSSENQAHVPRRTKSPAVSQPGPISIASESPSPAPLVPSPQTGTESIAPTIPRQDPVRGPSIPAVSVVSATLAYDALLAQAAHVHPQGYPAWNEKLPKHYGKVTPAPAPGRTINQPNQQLGRSQQNGHVAAGVPTSTTDNAPPTHISSRRNPGPVVSYSNDPCRPMYATTPSPSVSLSTSAVVQQPNKSNSPPANNHSRGFPMSGSPNPDRLTTCPEAADRDAPPAKVRRLDNGHRQSMVPQVPDSNHASSGVSSPGYKFVEPHRPAKQGKILKNREDLVKSISASLALEKASYDPATIARDVLITAGKHPTEKKLNHHLEALRQNFTRIDHHADLETFRWDLVDPEREIDLTKPPASVSRSAPRPVTQPVQQPALQPALRTISQSSRQPALPLQTPTAARLLASPYSTQANGVYARDTPPTRPMISSRIDARAPPSGLSSWGTLPFKAPAYYSPKRVPTSNIPSSLPNLDPIPPPAPNASPPKTSPPVYVPTAPSHIKPKTTSARPDLPPAVTKNSPKSTPKSTPKTASKSQTAKFQSSKSPETRRLPTPLVVIPPSSAKMPQPKRKPGRPPREKSGIDVAIHPREKPVPYQVFACQWEGCIAELHNLDAVRAHLVKVHVPHHLLCKWKGCEYKMHMAAADMYSHVANEHISKMAWELGDGPAVVITGENHIKSRYT